MKNISITTTIVKSRNGEFTIDLYKLGNAPRQKWIAVDRLFNILNLKSSDKKLFKHLIGSNSIKKIDINDRKVEIVDTLSLVRLNEFLLDEVFYRSILDISVWKDNIWFELDELINGMKIMRKYLDHSDEYYDKVNFYDRARSEIYHEIENTDNEFNKELKLCLRQRRIFKIKRCISESLLELADADKMSKILENMKYKVKANKEKRYNSRLTPEEKEAWESELIRNGLREKEVETSIEELAERLREGFANA